MSATDPPLFGHGLVLGKFYPPHAGHHFIVRQAASRCDRLTVVVLASDVESIPLADRVAWLRAEHADDQTIHVVGDVDNHPIDFDDPAIWDAHVAVTAAAAVRGCIEAGLDPDEARVDAVFTSEAYGDELARRFGATAVAIDIARANNPISGTTVRSDLLQGWDQLAPATRAGLARRIVVIGSESSGTTTLAESLALELCRRGGAFDGTRWVPEYGREYTSIKLRGLASQGVLAHRTNCSDPESPGPDPKDLCWTDGDFVHIAQRQSEAIADAAGGGSIVVIADTDAFATGVWFERYMNHRSPQVEAIGARSPGDLYLLTDTNGVAFEDDGLRDGEHLRAWMQETFIERLNESELEWRLISGAHEERVELSLQHIDQLLADTSFGQPLS